MRYALAGGVLLLGAVLIGLAYHNTVSQAWAAVTSQPGSSAGKKTS